MSQGFLKWMLEHYEEGLPATEPITLETVFRDFEKTIYRKGGDLNAVSQSFEALTYELFGCTVSELFQATDVPIGDFLKLPNVVQKAYIGALFETECALEKEVSNSLNGEPSEL
jgi:hypothetical protein